MVDFCFEFDRVLYKMTKKYIKTRLFSSYHRILITRRCFKDEKIHILCDIDVNARCIAASSIGEITDKVIMLSFCNAERRASDTENTPVKEIERKVAEKVVHRTENKKDTHSNRRIGGKTSYRRA